MKAEFKSDRHAALEARYPSKPRHIKPAPIRTVPSLLDRAARVFSSIVRRVKK